MHPQFLIIGAQRCGTTALVEALRQHPQIFVAEPREPEFFSTHARGEERRTWKEYLELFSEAPPGTVCGEASTGTMITPEAIPVIEEKLPGVRLIAIVRNPAERAYSGFLHTIRKGRLSMVEGPGVFQREAENYLNGIEGEYDWFSRSEYGRQLEPFITQFRGRMLVVVLEELVGSQREELWRAQKFLGLQQEKLVLSQENSAVVPKSRGVEKFLSMGRKVSKPFELWIGETAYRRFREHLMRRLGKRLDPIDPELKERLLKEGFAGDLARLEALLGRPIEVWK